MTLNPNDTRNGEVTVGLRVDLRSEDLCSDVGDADAELRNLRIQYRLTQDLTNSVASYMSPGARSVTVTTDADPSPQEQQAALNVATVAASLFGSAATISYQPEAPAPATPANDRVIRVAEGGSEPQIEVTDDVLTISGPPDTLTATAQALGSDYLPIAGEPRAVNPSASFAAQFGKLTQTLEELGLAVPPLVGIGQTDLDLPVDQAQFGRPVSGFTLNLKGAVTPAVQGTGRINVLWNGELLDSVAITDVSTFASTVSVSQAQTRRGNTLTVQLEYEPSDGCRSGVLPARFDLSPQSLITAKAGNTEPGFLAFPQTLTNPTPMVLTGGRPVTEGLQDGVAVLAGLQSLTPRVIQPQLLDFDAFLADSRPGIAIGVGPGQDGPLQTPLRYAPFRVVDGQTQQLSVQVAGSFAALQAYDTGERRLIVLGGTGREAADLMAALAQRANSADGGWGSLQSDIAVAQPSEPILFLGQTGLAVQEEKIAESSILSSGWLLVAVGFLILALIVGIAWRFVRGKRHG